MKIVADMLIGYLNFYM